jgi:hypothetical protein
VYPSYSRPPEAVGIVLAELVEASSRTSLHCFAAAAHEKSLADEAPKPRCSLHHRVNERSQLRLMRLLIESVAQDFFRSPLANHLLVSSVDFLEKIRD